MKSKEELLGLVDIYLQLFPGEVDRVSVFSGYLDRNGTDQLYTRKNFDGHITTSAFIIDVERQEILLLRHKSLERWLQPGGHTEGDVSLLASAVREAVEETGMAVEQLRNIAVHENSEVPFDIDSHYIPANPKKGEDAHFHHDFRYVFSYVGARDNDYNTDESTGMKWLSFASLEEDETFGEVVRKMGEMNVGL